MSPTERNYVGDASKQKNGHAPKSLHELNGGHLNSSVVARSEREVMSTGANSSYSAGATRGPSKRFG